MENQYLPLETIHLELKMVQGSRKSLSYSWRPNDASSIVPKHDESYQENIILSLNDVAKDGDMNRLLSMYLNRVDCQPTHQETTMLNGFRSTCQEAIDNLQVKRRQMLLTIEGLSRELTVLEEEMDYKGKQLAIASSIVAPIRHLPMELLTTIFRFTLCDTVYPASRRNPQLVLCRISKLWNHVAVKDPFLWSQIWWSLPRELDWGDSDDSEGVETEDRAIDRYRCLSEGIKLFSTRSGAVALDLSLCDQRSECEIKDPSPELKEYRKRALKDTRALFPRCRSLEFSSSRPSGQSFLEGVHPSVFSRLESLCLSLRRDSPAPETSIFSAAPLRRYELGTCFPADLQHFSLQHDKLEYVGLRLSALEGLNETISRDAVAAWRNFIIRCANLKVARIQYSGYERVNDQLEHPQTAQHISPSTKMNHLTTLILNVVSNRSFADLLRDIDFPVLDILHLSVPYTMVWCTDVSLTPRGKPFVEGKPFMETIQCEMPYILRLTALCLTRVHITDRALRILLRMMPQLQSLSVLKGCIQEETHSTATAWLEDSANLVSFLTIKDADIQKEGFNPPVPSLRTLRLYHNKKAVSDLITAFSRLARSRYQWMHRQAALSEENEARLDFETSPFQLYLTLEVPYESKQRQDETVANAIRSQLGPVHTKVLRPHYVTSFVYFEVRDRAFYS